VDGGCVHDNVLRHVSRVLGTYLAGVWQVWYSFVWSAAEGWREVCNEELLGMKSV
jgi:hypothetical protein